MAIILGADKLRDRLRGDIDAAERFFDSHLLDKITTRYQLVQGSQDYYSAKFPRLSRQSTYVDSSIADAIEWIMPSLLELFFGGSKIVSISGVTADDDPWPMEQLIQWQLMRQNKGFMIVRQWLDDSLKAGAGSLKVFWDRQTSKEREWVPVTAQELAAMPADEILDARDSLEGGYEVLVKQDKILKNQPRLVNLMPGQMIFSPACDADGRPLFQADRRYMTRDEVLRMAQAAKFSPSALKEAMQSAGRGSESLDALMQVILEDTSDETEIRNNPTTDRARDIFMPYDCLARYGADDSGRSEWIMATMINDVPVRGIRYPYEQSCYVTTKPYQADYQFWGHAVADLIQDLQDLKTALMRQVIVNVALNNERRVFFDASQTLGIQAWNEGRMAIPVNRQGQSSVNDLFAFAPHAPLSPETFSLTEMIQGNVEQRTGVTRYNQGLDSDSLNKTATGISRIMNASQQRIRMIARIIAETGFEPLLRLMVELNQKHMDQETVVRLTNERLSVRPDDLEGKFDVEVATGIGAVDQQQQVVNMSALMQNVFPSLLPLGIVTPQNFYNAAAKIVEGMGYRNVSDFLNDPASQNRMMGGVPAPIPGMPQVGPTPDMIAQALAGNGGGEVIP